MDTVSSFETRLRFLREQHAALIERENTINPAWSSGVFDRWMYPVLTAAHTPIFWRYDLNSKTNPI